MIDARAAYDRMAEILAAHGVAAETYYSVDISVTHHADGNLRVTFTVSAQPGGVCVMAYQKPTLEDGLDEFARLLSEHLKPPAPPIDDLRIELPVAEPAVAPVPQAVEDLPL